MENPDMKAKFLGVVFVDPCLMAVMIGQNLDLSSPPKHALMTRMADESTGTAPQNATSTPAPAKTGPTKHKLGPLNVSVDWRTRAEGWDWFQGKTEETEYPSWHSL